MKCARRPNPERRFMAMPTFGPRMVCTSCGIIGADARPNWLI
jgi:hypothetical protein